MAKKKVAKIEIIDSGSSPDVDSDFHTTYREKAIEHVAETYGKDNVANIVTFGTLAGKAAFKQMCTIYEVNFALANKITALYPPMIEGVSATLEDIYNPDSSRYAEGADFREAVSGKEWEKVIAGARAIEGRNKNTGVHACFVAGTLIKTSEGYKNIEDITVGDMVLTHTNSYKKVMDTMVNEDGEIFYLQAANSIPSKVTGEHPFYTRSIIRKNGGKIRELSEPVWKNVNELVVGDDLIGTPVNQKSMLPANGFDLPFEDPDFWWIAGRFLGDGWCEEFMSIRNRQRKDGTPYEYKRQEKNLVISVGYNDPTRSIFEEKLGKLFGYRTSAARTTVKFYVHGSDVFEYFKTFGKYAAGKRVPDEVLDLPVNLLKSFAEGYFSADGHYSKSNDRQSFSTVSRELALSMIAVVNKVYKTHCSVVVSKRDQMVIEGRTVDCHDKYQISFKENLEAKTRSFYKDGYIWAGLSKIVKIDDDELTYNFSVLDDNSYIANGLAVHNCGIIISNVPLSEAIPLHVRQKDQRTITQWTYPECESLGLLKMDFLGLDTVDLVQNAVKNILKSGKEAPNMIDLIHGPMDDPEVYKLFQRGETVGVFQFGSEMVQQLLHLTKPTEFADLPAITSVARPGPMGMQSHTKYADRKNGREEIDYIHPEFKGTVMEEILGKTYGLCIPAGTPILDSITGKYVPIEELVPNKSTTPSYNQKTEQFENKLVKNVVATGNKAIVRISFGIDENILEVSETHPVLTERGYIAAEELTLSDKLAVKVDDDLIYEPVIKIEEHGFADCYDIEVADNHNFVVEGVVVHNCIYQEQVQQISNRIAGMTLQEGDDLRRAMGKKKKKVMDAMRPKFYEGAMKNGFSEEAITQLWDTLEPFAKYGFNKCLYGRTMVSLPEGEGKISIEKLYERFVNGEKDIQILSMFEDGEIRPHTVNNIVQTGVKPLYKIKTKSGRIIRLTKEHRLLTPGGYGTIEDGVLTIGQELIVDAEWTKRLSEETILTRQRTMAEINRSDEQREKARERMIAYQKSLSFADRSAHQQQIQLNSPQRSVKPLRAMQERLSYLRKNDLEWQKQVLENSQKWFEETSAIRKGYGIPTVLSDGRVADSIAEAAAAEYLLSRGIDFEMHKVFTSVHGTAKITDFYVDGLYFEMDGLRRGREYFVKEKYGTEIPFVYLTPDNFGDEIDNALMKHHIENGDEIVEVIAPKVLENGSILREMTYDIEMDTTGPANFIANGIVSHNSHAVAYAMNSYQSAYLKAHYPVEFMSALIAQHVGDKNKTLMYLRDAKRMGLKVGSVDINLSETRVAPNYAKKNKDDYDIIFGLAGVQSVSSDMATIIIEEREKNGHYTSVKDLVDRCMPLGVDKRTVYENLALAGAFDCFGVSRKLAFENVVNLVDGSKVKAKNGDSLFEMFEVEDDSLEIDLFGEDYPFLTKLKKEAGMVGLYLTAHPTDKVSASLSGGSSHTIAKLLSMSGGKPVRTTMIASVLGIETKRSKRGAKSMLLDLDDGTGFMNVYLSKQIVSGIEKFNAQQTIRTAYEKGKTEVKEEILARAIDPEVKVVKDIEKYDLYMFDITYRAGTDETPYRVQVNSLKPLQLAGNGSLPVRIRYRLTDNNAEKIAKLERALPYNLEKKMPGDYPIYTTTYSENDLFVDDAVLYSTACKIMASSEEGEERVWPPAVKKTKTAQPSQEDIIQAIENLEYTDSGYTTDKSQRVEQAIEKYVGYGAYDFGIFNPESLED